MPVGSAGSLEGDSRTNDVESLWARESVAVVLEELSQIRAAMLDLENQARPLLDRIPESRRPSASNLLHYVSLRRNDLRDLQERLIRRGVSSLGRCEANVLVTVNVVMELLRRASGWPAESASGPAAVDFASSRGLLQRATCELFGDLPAGGGAHVMVTMPSEAAQDRQLVFDLIEHGMDCMRVNCAHDGVEAWQAMIANLRRASSELDRPCRVFMDLGGPKLRTGPIEPGPAVIRWRPKRDPLGWLFTPARLWLKPADGASTPLGHSDGVLPVVGSWLDSVRSGDRVSFTDARGRARELKILEPGPGGIWATSDESAYVVPGTELFLKSSRSSADHTPGRVGEFPPLEQSITLHIGDTLLLKGEDAQQGSPAKYDPSGQLLCPAVVTCTLPSVLADLKRGDRILFDDGKITARVESTQPKCAVLVVTHAAEAGSKLRADKGINLPDTDLHLEALTEKDLADLAFVATHADIVGYSFVRQAADVERLQTELTRLGRPDMPIVLKIENRQAFEGLPSLLLAALRSPVSGVMIARGDLAVELGWQRLAEVQEEILWMCEAAHLPVVWATQVLENLAKTGIPSRAEITDAAMSVRAECVMLNKGPHILEAVRVLNDILRRMKDHQIKKRPLLRRLRLADDLFRTQTPANE